MSLLLRSRSLRGRGSWQRPAELHSCYRGTSGLKSSEPLKHIYQRGLPGVSEDRVSLGASILDIPSGIRLRFEFDDTDESAPIDLMKHGYLEIWERNTHRLATSAFVTVSQEASHRLKLSFRELELGDEDAVASGNVPVVEPVADGRIIGEVERYCLRPPGSNSALDESNPFCQAQ